jgi:hypothetical protein
MEETVKGELPKEQLDLLINQYPGLKSIEFYHQETDEKAVVYIKKITRDIYATALNIDDKKDKLTLGEYLLKNLRVGGMDSKEIIEDIDWLRNWSAIAQTLIWAKGGEIKKN